MTAPGPAAPKKPRRPITAAGVIGAMLLGAFVMMLQNHFQNRATTALVVAVLAVIVTIAAEKLGYKTMKEPPK